MAGVVMIVRGIDRSRAGGIDIIWRPDQRVPNRSDMSDRVGADLVVEEFDLGPCLCLFAFRGRGGVRKVVDGKNVDGLTSGQFGVVDYINAVGDESTVEVFELEPS